MAQNKVSVMSHVSRHKVSRGMVKKKKVKKRGKLRRKENEKENNTAVYAFRHINSNTSSPCLPPR